jgi:YHS domain-containing protein
MEVDRASPPGGVLDIGGQKYFFCSTFCRAKFAGSKAGARP